MKLLNNVPLEEILYYALKQRGHIHFCPSRELAAEIARIDHDNEFTMVVYADNGQPCVWDIKEYKLSQWQSKQRFSDKVTSYIDHRLAERLEIIASAMSKHLKCNRDTINDIAIGLAKLPNESLIVTMASFRIDVSSIPPLMDITEATELATEYFSESTTPTIKHSTIDGDTLGERNAPSMDGLSSNALRPLTTDEPTIDTSLIPDKMLALLTPESKRLLVEKLNKEKLLKNI